MNLLATVLLGDDDQFLQFTDEEPCPSPIVLIDSDDDALSRRSKLLDQQQIEKKQKEHIDQHNKEKEQIDRQTEQLANKRAGTEYSPKKKNSPTRTTLLAKIRKSSKNLLNACMDPSAVVVGRQKKWMISGDKKPKKQDEMDIEETSVTANTCYESCINRKTEFSSPVASMNNRFILNIDPENPLAKNGIPLAVEDLSSSLTAKIANTDSNRALPVDSSSFKSSALSHSRFSLDFDEDSSPSSMAPPEFIRVPSDMLKKDSK